MKEITVQDLAKMREDGVDHQLIDVREPYEVEIATMGGDAMPMGEILNMTAQISKDKPVIVHCRSGKRSAAVIDSLERMHGFENLHNLRGGILAFAEEIDHSIPTY